MALTGAPPGTHGPLWKSVMFSLLAGAIWSGLGSVPGMGLPGAILSVPAVPLAVAIWGASDPFPGDSAWGFFILVTLASGPLIPLLWLGTRMLGFFGPLRVIVVVVAFALLGVALALLIYAIEVAPLLR